MAKSIVRGTQPPPGHKRLTINLPEDVHQALKVKAAREGTTIRRLIESSIGALMHEEPCSESVLIQTDHGATLTLSRRPSSTIALSPDGRIWAEARYPDRIIWTAEDGEQGRPS